MRVVNDVNASKSHVTIAWVPAPSDPARADPEAAIPEELDRERLYRRVPVIVDGRTVGRLELSESRDQERACIRTTIKRTFITTVITMALMGVVGVGLGMILVGRPGRLLIAKAHRIAEGDFSGTLTFRQWDEMATLADAGGPSTTPGAPRRASR